jgi:hypothetical protein
MEHDDEYRKKCEEQKIKKNRSKQLAKKLKRQSDPAYLERKLRREDPEYEKNLIQEKRKREKERFELRCKEDPAWCAAVRQKRTEQVKKWRKNNPEKVQQLKKKSRENFKLRYELDLEFRKKVNAKKEERHKEKMLTDPEYKKRINDKRNKRKKIKLETDPSYREKFYQKRRDKEKRKNTRNPLYRFRKQMSSMMRRDIKRGYKDNTLAHRILGADWVSVRAHIESQFVDGMSWENFGQWHMDHIIPLSLAKTEEEVIKLHHYKNIQPLWGEENLKKSNNIPEGVEPLF